VIFYLIELEVVKFQDYPPFPRFNLIVKPPETSLAKRMKRVDKTLTNAQKIRIDFWIELVEKIYDIYPEQTDIKITKHGWLSYPTDFYGIEYRYFIDEMGAGVALYFNNENASLNIQRIERLKSFKKEIEQRFNEIGWSLSRDLTWDIKEDREYQYIEYNIPGKGLRNEELWDKVQYEMIDAMKTLQGTLNENLQKLFN
jgi:hypothetical protein